VRKYQADISRIIKESEAEIDQSEKSAAVENERMEKELIKKLVTNYDSIEAWRKKYERLELLPLRKHISKIIEAKNKVWKWQKNVYIYYNSIIIFS
jgi:DNA/RNA-binding domain of Phe-tRNA-synthetase-like protein